MPRPARPTRGRTSVSVLLAATLAIGLATATAAPTAAQEPAAGAVTTFPEDGSTAASPGSEVSLRGTTADEVGDVVVVGETTGAKTGDLVEHSDGEGVSFVPDEPFAEGEQVTVETGSGVTSSFTVADTGPAQPTRATLESTEVQASATAEEVPEGTQSFVTRPDLEPTAVAVNQDTGTQQDGLVLIAPRVPGGQNGPMVIDDAGEVVWYQPSGAPFVSDLKVVPYMGQDVLTWYEGAFTVQPGVSAGEYVMVDRSYNPVARVRAGNGYEADLHDLEITDEGTALVLVYAPVAADLRAYGGTEEGVVLDQVIQEIDVPTGRVLFEWHSLDHLPLTESDASPPTTPGGVWDYLHGNSLDVDLDGDILMSARSASAVYKIDRTTGDLEWRLGHKGDFTPVGFSADDWFAAQHDARRRPDGTLSLLDNGGGGPGRQARNYTRGLVLALDETTMTATIVREVRRSPDLFSSSQANFQQLAGGHDLIGWGSQPVVTEFDGTGTAVWEARYPSGVQSYRAYRQPWTGLPTQAPDTAPVQTGHDAFDVHVSWNGATEVATWELLTGDQPNALTSAGSAPRDGFETVLPVSTTDPLYAVRARDAGGKVLGTSPVGVLGALFEEQEYAPGGSYALAVGDFGGSRDDDVFYYGHGTKADYLSLSDGGTLTAPTPVMAAGGAHQMKVGNFVGDERDEIVFWSPLGTRAWMWRFDGTTPQQTAMAVNPVDQAIVLDHNPDRTASVYDEILWASDAAGGDSVDHFRWPLGGRLTRTWILTSTQRRFEPIVGDFDGNGWADVFWYAAGTAPDYVWYFDGDRRTGTTGYTWTRENVNGPFTPLVGEFTGDGVDDLLWYRSGAARDWLWAGAGRGAWDSTPSDTGVEGVPTVLRSSPHYVVLHYPGAPLAAWYPATDVVVPSGGTPVPDGYVAHRGSFTAQGGDGLYLYKPGAKPRMLLPVLP